MHSRKTKMYTIYDSVAEIHSQFPFQAQNNNDALRGFKDAIENPKSEFSKSPLDYSLYYIGEYDVITGVITGKENPVLVASAKDVLRTEKPEDNVMVKEVLKEK